MELTTSVLDYPANNARWARVFGYDHLAIRPSHIRHHPSRSTRERSDGLQLCPLPGLMDFALKYMCAFWATQSMI